MRWSGIKKLFWRNNISEILQDPFIKRVRSLVVGGSGMLLDGNIEQLDFAVQRLPDNGSILEIGSYGGLSTNVITYLLRKYRKGNPFISCDAWIYEGFRDSTGYCEQNIDGRPDISRQSYSDYMIKSFISSVQFLSSNNLPHSLHMTSAELFNHWNKRQRVIDLFDQEITLGGDICLAYIDGGHDYDTAFNDFRNVSDHLVKGGFILLDDSGDNQFGSGLMMKDIIKDKRFSVISKKPNYLIKRV